MSDFPKSYTYGFAAGLLIGGGAVAVLAGVWFGWEMVAGFVETRPQAEGALIGGAAATIAFSLILAFLDDPDEVDHAE